MYKPIWIDNFVFVIQVVEVELAEQWPMCLPGKVLR